MAGYTVKMIDMLTRFVVCSFQINATVMMMVIRKKKERERNETETKEQKYNETSAAIVLNICRLLSAVCFVRQQPIYHNIASILCHTVHMNWIQPNHGPNNGVHRLRMWASVYVETHKNATHTHTHTHRAVMHVQTHMCVRARVCFGANDTTNCEQNDFHVWKWMSMCIALWILQSIFASNILIVAGLNEVQRKPNIHMLSLRWPTDYGCTAIRPYNTIHRNH